MRTLNSFTFISLNGYFKGENEDTSWHKHGAEEGKFSEESLETENVLLFGRKTYEMMHSFWPSQMAAELFPKVAEGMNKAQKIVFSNTLNTAEWNNSSVMSGDIAGHVSQLKASPGPDLTILGSGSMVSQLSDAGLIDTYQIMINPLALVKGTSLFEGMKKNLELKLVNSKVFNSGIVLLNYQRKD